MKVCFVPACKNTSFSTPEKEFIYVPENEVKRKAWFEAVGWNSKLKIPKTRLYCCDDHLNLEEDLDNYMYRKFMGGCKRLKTDVLPRFNLKKQDSITDSFHSAHSDCSAIKDDSMTDQVPDTDSFYSCSSITDTHSITASSVQLFNEKSVQVHPDTSTKACQTDRWTESSLISNIRKLKVSDVKNSTISSISSSILDTSSSIITPSCETASAESIKKLEKNVFKESVYQTFTKKVVEDNPKHLLGIDKYNMYIVDLLEKESGISRRDIYLVLKKIKTNLSFAILAYEFSLSQSQAGRIFKKNVHIIAKYMKQLIVWPQKKDILLNLPIPFRYRYKDVQSIIDCFEIELEKPSHATNQSLTYSEYKHCNTGKWLIAVSPDGLIIYISEGVSGRCTDKAIIENCGYIDVLAANSSVLADRGFKQVDAILQKKNCRLLRPPSVNKDAKSSKEDVKSTKQIASLRIHVERVINRIRNFQLLDIHTRVDNKLIECIDSCVYIVAGLVNLQSEIIKQT